MGNSPDIEKLAADDGGEVQLEFGPGDLVAIDFDGTLTKGRARYWEGEVEEPDEVMVEWVREQYYNGAKVLVWTARPWDQASTIAARLTEWEVPYHGIRCEKGGADGYVDDKAIPADQLIERVATADAEVGDASE